MTPGGKLVPAAAAQHDAGGSEPARTLRPRWAGTRRLIVLSLVALSSASATAVMAGILAGDGIDALEIAITLVFALSFAWIAISFWTAVIGCVLQAFAIDPITLRRRPLSFAPALPITARTVVVVPIYKEVAEEVFARLEAVYRSIERTGFLDRFEFFVLSDTPDGEIAAAEEACWARSCHRLDAEGRLFYRRRRRNEGRKAGNIAEFCRRWGRRWECMLVLDADSIMSGATIVELVRVMEANPHVGLLQTMPVPVGRHSLFARCIQFASRLYGPPLATGMCFWQLGESNYWGHNALIRMRAFIAHCGLPRLSGGTALGGEILSHDFVEAGLLRRAGWSVYLLPQLGGSYEEVPTNLIDFAARDRRWCQGNLQHQKLLAAPGWHPLTRLHFLFGGMAYLSSPLWLILLVLSTCAVVRDQLLGHDYFSSGYSLFPMWPVSKATEIVSLLAVTAGALLLPKVLAVLLVLADRRQRRGFGGTLRVLLGTVAEMAVSILIAPVMMGIHTTFVAAILRGKAVQWTAQERSERGVEVRTACVRLGPFLGAGLLWGVVIAAGAPDYIWWTMPVLSGLLLAIPLAVLSSRSDVGRWLGRRGLLVTPEEISPPSVLRGAPPPSPASRASEAAAASRTPPPAPSEMPIQHIGGRPPQRRSAAPGTAHRAV